MLAGGLLVLAVAAAVLAPVLAPADPTKISLSERLNPPFWHADGSTSNPLGTDHLGRDVLSRLLFGARITLIVGFVTVLIASTFGLIMGVFAGYGGGHADTVIMRIVDIELSFPFMALAVAIVAVVGPGVSNTILVLSIGAWVIVARLVRGEVLSLREREFVLAARSLGASRFHIMLNHILPNVASPVIVTASFVFAIVIVVEASLSFIGLGVQPPQSSWGLMLSEARDYMQVAWWLAAFPGLAIVLVVLPAQLLGDWLRDTLDPTLRNQ